MQLVKEIAGRERRKLAKSGAMPLRINSEACFAVGIDLGKSATQIVTVDLSGQIRKHHTESSLLHLEPHQALSQLKEVLGDLRLLTRSVIGIGLAVHGPMDDHTRRVTTVPYFPKWENVPVEEMMNDMLPLSVMVGNDSRLAAYAVHWWGAAQDLSNFVYFKVGSCVGGAVITQGNLHRGSQDIAGEFGHLVVELNGPPCACGGYGCLELYASARGITEYVHAHKGVPRRVTESHADYMKTMETVAQRAEEGDAIAQEALDRAAQYLAAGIASVIYCTDPEAVVINWEPTHGEAFFIERVSYHMRRRLFRHIANNIHILTDTLDQDASAVGAATLHLARVYENPEVYRVTT